MKKIIIYQENSYPVVLYDDDKSNINEYKNNFYKLFNINNIVELNNQNEFLLIRPSKLNGIHIKEINKKNEKTESIQLKNEEENFITDGE